MYCPNCHAEYREGFAQCAQCHVPLVATLPTGEEGDPDAQMVEVFRSANPLEISLAQTLLEEAGLEFSLLGDELRFLLGAGGGGLAGNPTTGPAWIVVRSEDEKRARQVLENLPEEQEMQEEEESEDWGDDRPSSDEPY